MSDSTGGENSVSEKEIQDLISKHAEKHDVPEKVLYQIYVEEKAVVGMERRGSIYKDVDSILREYVNKKLDEES